MKLIKNKIQWECRYSVTNEDDKHGRWARVAYAGRFGNLGIFKNNVCRWEIGWIKKVKNENGNFLNKYVISTEFPYNEERVFDNLEDAKRSLEKYFRWFIKMCELLQAKAWSFPLHRDPLTILS